MSENRKKFAAGRPRSIQAPRRREDPEKRRSFWPYLAGLGVVALLAASFVVPPLFKDATPSAAPQTPGGHGHQAVPGEGDGPMVGDAPRFDERDAVTGASISSETLKGKKTLLFFSEGVMCQACFVQIQDIEKVGVELEKRGIGLVSITPDSPNTLQQAISQYEIKTPMIADDDNDMSSAFDTLGLGMHPDTPGHAFALIDEQGEVVWYRDYWLDPYRAMYMEPAKILADIPK